MGLDQTFYKRNRKTKKDEEIYYLRKDFELNDALNKVASDRGLVTTGFDLEIENPETLMDIIKYLIDNSISRYTNHFKNRLVIQDIKLLVEILETFDFKENILICERLY